jgi:DNA segregation ATPase FtsK/SpoIIIE-like protein
MPNFDLIDQATTDQLHARALKLVAESPRVQRTDGIAWLQRHLKIGYHQAIGLMDRLVASGEMIRVPEVFGYSYIKAGNGDVHRIAKVVLLTGTSTTWPVGNSKWRQLFSHLGEIELEVDVVALTVRGEKEISESLHGLEWDYLIVDPAESEFAPL